MKTTEVSLTNSQVAVPCSVMRGGTSKGLYFLASDLPKNSKSRNRFLLAAMGSPDVREIDGMGGGHPLTSKVAVISKSNRPGIDVDYLFLQVWPDRAEVSDEQNCGNILAGVGPFSIEKGLVAAKGAVTPVAIYMVNSNSKATAFVETPGGAVNYAGNARIDGVPGSHAPVNINFDDIAGSTCGALLPTGNVIDLVTVPGLNSPIEITCIDNGMPVVCLKASDFGISGNETPKELEANQLLLSNVEDVRLAAGRLMNLGDVAHQTVPKMSLISPANSGGVVNTRSFIPHRVHEAIGVLGAVSVATACMLPGSVANQIAEMSGLEEIMDIAVEHPTGSFTVHMEVSQQGEIPLVRKSALLRTARMLMTGHVFVPKSAWGE